jgi:hypothetical protein
LVFKHSYSFAGTITSKCNLGRSWFHTGNAEPTNKKLFWWLENEIGTGKVIFLYSQHPKSGRPFCFSHSKSGQIGPDFEWSTSLDRFIIEGHKKYFVHDKTVKASSQKCLVWILNVIENRTKNPSSSSPFENRIVRI